MNEKVLLRERLYGRGDILKQRIYDGDRSLKTLKAFAEILDQLEELREHPLPRLMEAKPIA